MPVQIDYFFAWDYAPPTKLIIYSVRFFEVHTITGIGRIDTDSSGIALEGRQHWQVRPPSSGFVSVLHSVPRSSVAELSG